MSRSVLAWGGLAVLLGSSALAQPSADELLNLDLEKLVELPISLASRREQRAGDAAAAVHVIDREALQRSGVLRLPDALRLVPGLHVGKWDANKWAIGSRNGMSRFNSTMLLLVDGRPAYTPLFGGVRWENFDLPIDEIERIEVVRGPGGPLWGANAVDGIISIVTRRADHTLGQHAMLGAGDGDVERLAEARTGHALGQWSWRLSLRWMDAGPGRLPPIEESTWTTPRAVGSDAKDEGVFRTALFRADGPKDDRDGSWTIWLGHREGSFIDQRIVGTQLVDNTNWFDVDHAAAEWRGPWRSGQDMVLRASVERTFVGDAVLVDDQRVADFDAQVNGTTGRFDWAWGVGFSHYRSDTRTPARSALPPCTACFGADPQVVTDAKRSAFVQVQSTLSSTLALVTGAKVEDSRGMDWDVQPTIRLRWQPGEGRDTLWSGWTRALRSSTRLERDGAFFNVPPGLAPTFGCRAFDAGTGVCSIGNPDQFPWKVDVVELGWRRSISATLSVDTVAFHSRYTDVFGSRVRDRVEGVEGILQWDPDRRLRVEALLTWHQGRDRIVASGALVDTSFLPRWSNQLHLQWTPTRDIDVDLRWTHGSSRETASARIGTLPPIRRLDARVAWRPAPGWESAVTLGNGSDERDSEYLESLRINTQRGSSVFFSLRRSLP